MLRRIVAAGLCLQAGLACADFDALLWDNDLFSPDKTDAYYTNGLIYHHVSAAESPARGADACLGLGRLARFMDDHAAHAVAGAAFRHSLDAGQIINTPEDLRRDPPDPLDQPYSGLLFASCGVHLQAADHALSLTFLAGVVGPLSLAERSQEFVHRVTGDWKPSGWHGQLHNEAVVNLSYAQQDVVHRFTRQPALLFVNAGADAGPLLTSVHAGINYLYAADTAAAFSLRPDFSGRYLWLSSPAPGFYGLAGLQAHAVLRNLFLDGNTWRDSPSVGHEPLLGEAQLIAGYGFPCLALQLGLHAGTPAFDGQKEQWPRYGTLAVMWGCGP